MRGTFPVKKGSSGPYAPIGRIAGHVVAFLARTAVSWSYLAILAAVGLTLENLGGGTTRAAIGWASTNLANLEAGHFSTLLISAFVIDGTLSWLAWVQVAAVLVCAELAFGHLRLIGLFLAGHVGATLAVAAGLAVGIGSGRLPPDWSSAPDVGVSYGLAALIGAVVARLPRNLRVPCAIGLLAAGGQALVSGQTFTDAGHLCALVIGLVAATIAGSPAAQALRPRRSSSFLVPPEG